MEPGLSQVRQAIYVYRNGEMNSVQIERQLGVPPRTLRRYVAESLDPTNRQFYLKETTLERQGRMVKEASDRFGLYSEQSFVVASQYMPLPAASGGSGGGGGGAAVAAPAATPTAAPAAAVIPPAPRLVREPSLGGTGSLGSLGLGGAAGSLSGLASPAAVAAPFVDFDFSFDPLDNLDELHSLDTLLAEQPAAQPAAATVAADTLLDMAEQQHGQWRERSTDPLAIFSR